MNTLTDRTLPASQAINLEVGDPTPRRKILILGLGNPMCGDDGLGNSAVQMLIARGLPPGVVALSAGTPGWELPNWFEGWPHVILIDAVQMGQKPGTRRRFDLDEVKLIATGEILSSHTPDLATGLALADALNQLPEEITVYGVEPERCEPGTDLSQNIEATLGGLVDDILREIK